MSDLTFGTRRPAPRAEQDSDLRLPAWVQETLRRHGMGPRFYGTAILHFQDGQIIRLEVTSSIKATAGRVEFNK